MTSDHQIQTGERVRIDGDMSGVADDVAAALRGATGTVESMTHRTPPTDELRRLGARLVRLDAPVELSSPGNRREVDDLLTDALLTTSVWIEPACLTRLD